MKQLTFLFLGVLVFNSSLLAQAPRFAKYQVSETGAALYMPLEPYWDLTFSEDSSEVYTTEVEFDSAFYGAIVVKFAESLGEDSLVWQELLLSYLGYLNDEAFLFIEVTDPGLGHRLDDNPTAIGILEYGEDFDGIQYTVKGWIDDQFLAILYVAYEDEMNYNIQEMYLQGFRFP